MQTRTRRALWFLFAACFVTAAGLAWDHLEGTRRADRELEAAARALASKAAASIDERFRGARAVADGIVKDLSSGALPYSDIEERLRRECEARADIDGVAVSFEPFAYGPAHRLYMEYVSRNGGTLSVLKGSTYDYTLPPSDAPGSPKTAWYHGPRTGGPMWNEPFLATGAGRVLIEFGAPFFLKDNPSKVAGVVTVDFSLGDLQEMMARLDLGDTGYGMASTSKGTFLAHPDRAKVVHGSAFGDGESVDPPLQEAFRRALAGVSGVVDYKDPITGLDVWALYEPIPSTRWALVLVLQKLEPAHRSLAGLRRWTTIALVSAASFLALLGLGVRLERGFTAALWFMSLVSSACAVAIIVLVWVLAWDVHRAHGVPVASRVSVERYVERHRASLTRAETLYTVPTGIEITAIKFPDASTVVVGGRIWQRYANSIPGDVTRGFVLPQHLSEESIIEELERSRRGSEEVIVWRFVATLQQSFNPMLFPFDRRDIAILIHPAELEANVVLVPDLSSYRVLATRALPGLGRDRQILNWRFQECFFSYRMEAGSSLGLSVRESRPTVPALYFNIAARRMYLGPFIAYLLPALVAAALAFAYLMTRRGGGTLEDLLSGLGYIAALFFVVVVTHTALRDNIGAVGITYLELVFILLYVVVGLVVFDAFAVANHPEWWMVRFRHHLPAKLLYWPVISFSLLAATLVVFVYA